MRPADGEAFCHLSGEDIAAISPVPKQFISASKSFNELVWLIATLSHLMINTSDLFSDLDETLSRSSKPCASGSNSTTSDSTRNHSKSDSDGDLWPKERHSDQSSSSTGECS